MNKTNKRLKKLKTQDVKIRNEINKIEEEEINKVQKPRLKAMIGQCFVYRNNCHSCPKNKKDYWNNFKKILEWIDTKERGFYFKRAWTNATKLLA